jgi:micrococcal nuclease
MLRRCVVFLTLLCSLAVPSIPARAEKPPLVAAQPQDCPVYVTKTGHKYHRAGCQYLKSSAFKMRHSEAVKAGYTACKRCGGSTCE